MTTGPTTTSQPLIREIALEIFPNPRSERETLELESFRKMKERRRFWSEKEIFRDFRLGKQTQIYDLLLLNPANPLTREPKQRQFGFGSLCGLDHLKAKRIKVSFWVLLLLDFGVIDLLKVSPILLVSPILSSSAYRL
ncbi:hypothetical protein CMV_013722 [Castanea mollissima]|uniref:Uncharacterized protein n=1 Tax=Castanea mollissima TaxID=60419 RepID=A0A8J4RCK1_9ROSI|nr:hypothetical protein CMV_013722 [Castanea mollissima]